MELLEGEVEVDVEGEAKGGMNPSACAKCGSLEMTDKGESSPGTHVFKCRGCGAGQEVIFRNGKPVGLVLPGDGPSTAAYRMGEEPINGLPRSLPCGCKRTSKLSVLLANGSRVCIRHQARFRVVFQYVKE